MPDKSNNKKTAADILMKNTLRPIWHLIYWGTGYIILLRIFSPGGDAEKIDYIYTIFFLTPICMATYLNLYLLVPAFLRKGRILIYILFYGSLIGLSAWFLELLFERWIDFILKDYYFISYDEYPVLIIYVLAFTAISTLLKISREWFELLKRQKEAETLRLKSLQSQVNPHFLLNSLQTIYSLSIDKSNKTPNTILQLSEILKFTIYETKDELVLLKRELEVMKNYVEMQRLRSDRERVKIDFRMNGDPAELRILPLLFLPFIENSFKHGPGGAEKDAFVDIDFTISGKFLKFTATNNAGKADQTLHEGFSGMGIENTRKRLMLYYPKEHELNILDNEETYSVTLELKLSRP